MTAPAVHHVLWLIFAAWFTWLTVTGGAAWNRRRRRKRKRARAWSGEFVQVGNYRKDN